MGVLMKAIIYDEKDMSISDMLIAQVDFEPEYLDITCHHDRDPQTTLINRYVTFTGTLDKNMIKLDPTTMKKILMYNKDVEFKKVNEDIDYYKKQLEYAKQDYERFKRKLVKSKRKQRTS